MLAQRQNVLLVCGRQVPAIQTDVLHVRKSYRANVRSLPGEFIKNSQQNPESLNFSVVYVDCLPIRSITLLLMTFHFTFVKNLLLKGLQIAKRSIRKTKARSCTIVPLRKILRKKCIGRLFKLYSLCTVCHYYNLFNTMPSQHTN